MPDLEPYQRVRRYAAGALCLAEKNGAAGDDAVFLRGKRVVVLSVIREKTSRLNDNS